MREQIRSVQYKQWDSHGIANVGNDKEKIAMVQQPCPGQLDILFGFF